MNPEEVKPNTFPNHKARLHPLIASFPAHLKDPKNYKKIQKVITESLAGKHSHGEVSEWAKCFQCQKRFSESRGLLKKLGFKNPAQYFAWRRIHEKIEEFQKIKLPKYNKPIV